MTPIRSMRAHRWALLAVVALAIALPPPVNAIGAREAATTFRRAHPRSTLVVHDHLDTAHLVVFHDDDAMARGDKATPAYRDVHALLAAHNVLGAPAGAAAKAALRHTGSRHNTRTGHLHATYQQFHRDIPVFGGVIKTAARVVDSVTKTTALRTVSGVYNDRAHDFDADSSVAAITADEAKEIAFQHVSSEHGVSIDSLLLSRDPELNWVNPSLIDHTSKIATVLAWRMHVHDESVSVHRNLFVAAGEGAYLGTVSADYSLVAGALNRTLYEVSVDTEPIWSEGDAPLPPGDHNNTMVGSEIVYNALQWGFGRASFDDLDSEMITVYDASEIECPNAQWNGFYTSYCPGTAEIDIVAHEWGHALTQYTADLIYAYQPGALNEAYSDILGTGIATNLFNNEDLILSERTELDSCSSYGHKATFVLEVIATAPNGTVTFVSTPIAVANTALWFGGFPGNNLAVEIGAESSYSSYYPFGGLACDPVDTSFEDGDIVLVNNGLCATVTKLENVIDAGASGMIVVNANYDPISPPEDLGSYADTHPVAMISFDGTVIQEWLAEGRMVDQEVNPDVSVDDTHRWLVGHNSSAFGGAIRDMWAPECFGHPGSISSTVYHCDEWDSGGVHLNSGVVNRLFALAVDGSAELGMTGLGTTKAYHIHFYALENLHTPVSSFAHHGAYLAAACDALVGIDLPSFTSPALSGEIIQASDCDELDKAIDATGVMDAIPCSFELLLPDEFEQCKDYTELAYSVDFQTSDGGFTVENYGVYPEWVGLDWVWTTERGLWNHPSPAWFAPNPHDLGTCYEGDSQAGLMTMTSPVISVSLADGQAFGVKFSHVIQTEAQYDAGVVFYTINGGNATLVSEELFSTNGYNDYLSPGDNPLSETIDRGFSGAAADLRYPPPAVSSFELPDVVDGDEIQISFVFGIDGCSGFNGWEILNISTYSCSACGDGFCGTGETCSSCPQDCDCVCGNGVCEQTFASDDCPSDCRGDGICQDGEFATTDCCGPLEDCFLTNSGDWWVVEGSYDPFTNLARFRAPDFTGLHFQHDDALYYFYYPSDYSGADPLILSTVVTSFLAPPPGMSTTFVVDIFTTCGSSYYEDDADSPDTFAMKINGAVILGFDNDTSATNDLCTDPETINFFDPPKFDEIEIDVTEHLVPGEAASLVIEAATGYGDVKIDRIRVRVEPSPVTTTPMPTTTTSTTSTSTEMPTSAAPVDPDCVDPSDVSQLEGACTEFCEDNVCDDTAPFIGLMVAGWVAALLAVIGLAVCAMRSSSSKAATAAKNIDSESVPMSTQVSAGASSAPAVSAPAVSSAAASSSIVSSATLSSATGSASSRGNSASSAGDSGYAVSSSTT